MIPRRMKILIAILLLSLGAAAQASEPSKSTKGRRSVEWTKPTQILGVVVPPGSYTLRWAPRQGSDQLSVEVARGGKVLASGTGAWIQSPHPAYDDALVYRAEGDKTSLAEIQFGNS